MKLNFYVHTSLWCLKRFYEGLCGASKRFMKAFKAFIKPSEVPQRSVKKKFNLIFFSSSLIGTGRVMPYYQYFYRFTSDKYLIYYRVYLFTKHSLKSMCFA